VTGGEFGVACDCWGREHEHEGEQHNLGAETVVDLLARQLFEGFGWTSVAVGCDGLVWGTVRAEGQEAGEA